MTAETEARRQTGSKAHREIGHQTDVVWAAGPLQTVLLVALGVLLLVLLEQGQINDRQYRGLRHAQEHGTIPRRD